MLKVFISIDSKVFYEILIKKKLAAASGGGSPDAAADINIRYFRGLNSKFRETTDMKIDNPCCCCMVCQTRRMLWTLGS